MIKNKIDQYAEEIYIQNRAAGWWPENPDERDLFTCLQLVSTEVAEATEGLRKDLMDDHLPQYKMEAVELVDALIRVLDLGGYWMSKFKDFRFVDMPHHTWCDINESAGKQHLGLNKEIITLADQWNWVLLYPTKQHTKSSLSLDYSALIASILQVTSNKRYPVEEILLAKREYNARRADHKLENRAKDGEKKF